jgi:ATP-dependent Clp protease ATP-binding subunit ClpA
MQQAMVVVRELHHDRIEPGHLLLGVLRVDDPVVTQVLARSGTSVAALSASVLAGLAAA